MDFIPYGRQEISEEDISKVVEVLRSPFITQGPVVGEFESLLTKYVGVRFAVAVNSATSALHAACLSLGLSKNDYVWTSPITFLASANCALLAGANVDFVDIDPKTYNLCSEALEEKLLTAQKEGKLPKIVIPVHFAGQSCDMAKIHELSLKYGFRIIEDASHAIGGKYLQSRVGSCKYSDITVFSFHPVKIITTGEGGVAVTNCASLAEKMKLFACHGMTRDKKLQKRQQEGAWCYDQIELGYNYRMTDIHAALGVSQLSRLDGYISRRHELFRSYEAKMREFPIILPYQSMDCYSALHLFPIKIKDKTSRKRIFNQLREKGIGVNVHYIPVYKHTFYSKLGFPLDYLPEAEKYYEGAITLPIYPGLTEVQVDYIVSNLERALG